MSDRLTKEIELFGELQKLLKQADEVRKCFMSAGLPLPGPLIRLLGNEEKPSKNGENSQKRDIPLMPAHRPEAAKEDWIAIKIDKLSAQDLVLAFLQDNTGPLSTRALYEKIRSVNPDIGSGTVYNIGPRMINKKILDRNDDGKWILIDSTKAPLIENDYAWGPPSVFSQQSLAAWRREQILQILMKSPDGLTTMQITKSLLSEGIDISKDLAMCDMKVLHKKGEVKRSGKHKKWSIIHE